MRDRQERNDGQRCRRVALVRDRRLLMVAVLAVALIYATVLWRRRRGSLEQLSERATVQLYEREAERESRSRSRAPVSGVRARKSRPCAVALKKIEQGGRPCSQDAFQRYAYASKFLGDRDGGGFAPACSSQDLDRVGRRRCPPLSLAGWTLSHLG